MSDTRAALLAAFSEWKDISGYPDIDVEELADVAMGVFNEDGSEEEQGPEYIACPKCHNHSGDSWSQCRGFCPMPMSPHFSSSAPRGWRFSGASHKWNQLVNRAERALKEGGVFPTKPT